MLPVPFSFRVRYDLHCCLQRFKTVNIKPVLQGKSRLNPSWNNDVNAYSFLPYITSLSSGTSLYQTIDYIEIWASMDASWTEVNYLSLPGCSHHSLPAWLWCFQQKCTCPRPHSQAKKKNTEYKHSLRTNIS